LRGVGCQSPQGEGCPQRSTAGHRAPRARTAGLPKPPREECGDGPGPPLCSSRFGQAAGAGEGLFVMRVSGEAAQVFEDSGSRWGADLVNAHGPFAEVDLAAAVTAKGKSSSFICTSIPQVGQWRSFTDFFLRAFANSCAGEAIHKYGTGARRLKCGLLHWRTLV